ncbi:MAG: hypothetical protein RMX26_10755 [Planktomarina sp.]|nr:hypothetical protein [Planktomarina sp.]
MNKIVILTLATTAALTFSPASATDHRGDRPEERAELAESSSARLK